MGFPAFFFSVFLRENLELVGGFAAYKLLMQSNATLRALAGEAKRPRARRVHRLRCSAPIHPRSEPTTRRKRGEPPMGAN